MKNLPSTSPRSARARQGLRGRAWARPSSEHLRGHISLPPFCSIPTAMPSQAPRIATGRARKAGLYSWAGAARAARCVVSDRLSGGLLPDQGLMQAACWSREPIAQTAHGHPSMLSATDRLLLFSAGMLRATASPVCNILLFALQAMT